MQDAFKTFLCVYSSLHSHMKVRSSVYLSILLNKWIHSPIIIYFYFSCDEFHEILQMIHGHGYFLDYENVEM